MNVHPLKLPGLLLHAFDGLSRVDRRDLVIHLIATTGSCILIGSCSLVFGGAPAWITPLTFALAVLSGVSILWIKYHGRTNIQQKSEQSPSESELITISR